MTVMIEVPDPATDRARFVHDFEQRFMEVLGVRVEPVERGATDRFTA